jgi:riboflavin kinase/FMN adenylyltransferase
MKQHVQSLADLRLDRPSVVTIGVFDGVHRGHQHLICELVSEARSTGRLAVAITFFPHPDVVIRGWTGRYYLTTPEDRAALLAQLGIDYVVTLSFDDQLRQIRAADFVDQLLRHLNMSALWVGSDFAMGYKREGNIDFLRLEGSAKGFQLEVIDLIVNDHAAISSSAIREALLAGRVERARDLLGRSYAVSGEVVHGEARGRRIGFPTANIAVWDQLIIPANGVYAGWASLDDEPERFMAVTNVGVRPTFNGDSVTVEAHLLDFDRDIYGRRLHFTFEHRLRSEMRFGGIAQLIDQIKRDVEAGRAALTQSAVR